MTNHSQNKSIENLFLGFFICLPLVFSKTILDPFLLPRLIFTISFLGVILIILQGEKRFNESYIFNNLSIKLLVLYLFTALVSFNQSLIISESHAVLSRQAVIFIFFILTTFLMYENLIRPEKLILSVIYFGSIAIVISLLAIVNKTINGQNLFRQVEQISGTFANKNLLSSILFLCFPFYFIGTSYSKKYRLLSITAIVLTVFVLMILRTRAVLLALIICFVLLVSRKVKLKYEISFKKIILASITSVIFIFFTIELYFRNKIEMMRFTDNGNVVQYFYRLFSTDTLGSRILYWKNSILMFNENYLLGVGLGNWQFYFPKYGLNNFISPEVLNGIESVQNPHNDFLWVLCETGIIGFIFYFGFIFFTLYQSFWLVKNTESNAEKWVFYYLFCGIIGYLIVSFFDFPSSRIEHQVVFMVALAIVNAFYYRKKGITNKTKSRIGFYWIFVFCLGYSLVVSLNRFESETHVLKLVEAKAQKNWSKVIAEASNASSWFYGVDSNLLPLEWYQGVALFSINEYSKSQELFFKAYSKTPYNLNVINNYASTLELNKDRKNAILLYEKALVISNDFEEARLNLAACYYNEEAFEKSFYTIDKCDINTKNLNYQLFLVPIVEKKLNLILQKINNSKLNIFIKDHITNKEELVEMYFDSKNRNISFENYVKKLK